MYYKTCVLLQNKVTIIYNVKTKQQSDTLEANTRGNRFR